MTLKKIKNRILNGIALLSFFTALVCVALGAWAFAMQAYHSVVAGAIVDDSVRVPRFLLYMLVVFAITLANELVVYFIDDKPKGLDPLGQEH